jgi:hypothetical protein
MLALDLEREQQEMLDKLALTLGESEEDELEGGEVEAPKELDSGEKAHDEGVPEALNGAAADSVPEARTGSGIVGETFNTRQGPTSVSGAQAKLGVRNSWGMLESSVLLLILFSALSGTIA